MENNLNMQNNIDNGEKFNGGSFVSGFFLTIIFIFFITPFIIGFSVGIISAFNIPTVYSALFPYVVPLIIYALLIVWAFKKKKRNLAKGSLVAFFTVCLIPVFLFGACLITLGGLR